MIAARGVVVEQIGTLAKWEGTMELDQNTERDLGAAPQHFGHVQPPSFLGSACQGSRALLCVGRLRPLVVWRAFGGHWLLRNGQLLYRGLTDVLATTLQFADFTAWQGDVFVPSPRDVIEELSRRGYDIITSPTRIADKPLRVVARRSDVPTVPPIEVADETLYLALLRVLENVARLDGERPRA
ncbi:MAG: hypothetical protein U1E76_23955 [Planctomycetota bacterium]